jgi:thioesterase domain-containing protein
MRSIHDAPTPRSFAEHLGGQDATVDDRILSVQLNSDQPQPVVVLLHHVGVNARFARALGERLDHPITAMFDRTAVISPSGELPRDAKVVDIAEATRLYADEILRLHGDQDLLLMGHCQGAILAHEVAVELARRGRPPVGVMAVLDWHAPHLEVPLQHLRRVSLSMQRNSVIGVLRQEAQMVLRAIEARVRPSSVGARHHRIAQATYEAFDRHEYSRYDGRALVVRRADDPRWPGPGEPTGWHDEVADLEITYITGPPFDDSGPDQLSDLIRREVRRAHQRS